MVTVASSSLHMAHFRSSASVPSIGSWTHKREREGMAVMWPVPPIRQCLSDGVPRPPAPPTWHMGHFLARLAHSEHMTAWPQGVNRTLTGLLSQRKQVSLVTEITGFMDSAGGGGRGKGGGGKRGNCTLLISLYNSSHTSKGVRTTSQLC